MTRSALPGGHRAKGTGSVYMQRGKWFARPPRTEGNRWPKPIGPFDMRHQAERGLDALRQKCHSGNVEKTRE